MAHLSTEKVERAAVQIGPGFSAEGLTAMISDKAASCSVHQPLEGEVLTPHCRGRFPKACSPSIL